MRTHTLLAPSSLHYCRVTSVDLSYAANWNTTLSNDVIYEIGVIVVGRDSSPITVATRRESAGGFANDCTAGLLQIANTYITDYCGPLGQDVPVEIYGRWTRPNGGTSVVTTICLDDTTVKGDRVKVTHHG